MEINIQPQNVYINQTATADVEGRHYELDYQMQRTADGPTQLVYLNATFNYGSGPSRTDNLSDDAGSGQDSLSTTEEIAAPYVGTLTWGQGMLQLPRALTWSDDLWQYVKDFGDIVGSITSSVEATNLKAE